SLYIFALLVCPPLASTLFPYRTLFRSRDCGGVTVLELSGQSTVGEESSQLRFKTKAVMESGRTDLVIDFGRVGYIDSTGLGTILAVFTTAKSLGANIKLAALGKKFRDQL